VRREKRITGILKLREAYEESLRRHDHERDAEQERIVTLLGDLQLSIESRGDGRRGVLRWLRRGGRQHSDEIPGLYLWGGVGRGKTFLMDLFFDCLAVEDKRRVHFHRMMHSVHAQLKTLDGIEDPLDRIAEHIARSTQVLCFDEFYVSDIADAMILGRLLEGIFTRGVVLVATSNTRPDDLYRDGLQRQRFLPAIDLINAHTHVVEMGGSVDYRLRLLQQSGTYLTPDDAASASKLQYFFDESASCEPVENRELDINGRNIRALRTAKGIAWFDFDTLCDGPRSQNDYIELARWYPAIIVSGVPRLDSSQDDQARRFIALVDEFYDRRVKLILSAAVPADRLYTGQRLRLEFDRTVSRLMEMQSTDYLAAPHLA
jgi:cell division protein ZapE